MSEPKKPSSKEKLAGILEKMALNDFEALMSDLLENRKSNKVVFDLSLVRSIIGTEDDLISSLAEKYHIAKTDVTDGSSALAYLFKQLFTNKREELVKKLKENEKIGDKASSIVEIVERLDKRFRDVRDRFYVTSLCKTSYFGDIDWEIVFKVIEPSIYHFEKKERFPVCTVRLILERSIPLVRPIMASLRKRECVFEVSQSDLDRMIATLSEIRDKMIEANKETVMREHNEH